MLVYGDTNSTLAGALSAVKLHLPARPPRGRPALVQPPMPEEHNRVLTDHAADLCLAPTEVAHGHLRRRGAGRPDGARRRRHDRRLPARPPSGCGDRPAAAARRASSGDYVLSTIHRAENTDDPQRLARHHRRPRRARPPGRPHRPPAAGGPGRASTASTCTQGSLHTDRAPRLPGHGRAPSRHARAVVTDSGGLQKEAFLLRTPCTTVRTETEWTETVDLGWNVLAARPRPSSPRSSTARRPPPTDAAPYGDGHAADATVRAARASGSAAA